MHCIFNVSDLEIDLGPICELQFLARNKKEPIQFDNAQLYTYTEGITADLHVQG